MRVFGIDALIDNNKQTAVRRPTRFMMLLWSRNLATIRNSILESKGSNPYNGISIHLRFWNRILYTFVFAFFVQLFLQSLFIYFSI